MVLWIYAVQVLQSPQLPLKIDEQMLAHVPHNQFVIYLDNLFIHTADFDGVLDIRRAGLHLDPRITPCSGDRESS